MINFQKDGDNLIKEAVSITMAILKIVLFVCLISVIFDDVACISLKNIQNISFPHNHDSKFDIQCKSSIVKHFVRQRDVVGFHPSKTTANINIGNICVLEDVASCFDVNHIRFIVSKQYSRLISTVKTCRNASNQSIERTVVYIKGDENSFHNLKTNALNIFSRNIKCFVMVCSDICTSLMLQIAVSLGFGLHIYLWITITQPAHINDLTYPNKVMYTTLTRERSNQSADYIITKLHMIGTSGIHGKQWMRGLGSKTKQSFMELTKPAEDERYFIINQQHLAVLTAKTTLKVVMVIDDSNNHQTHLLDRDEMKCQQGLLCWYYPSRNGSVADEREPSCCVGLVVDILLQVKEDLGINIYMYEVADRQWGSESNGTWKGLIGEVLLRKADVAVQWLIVNTGRLRAVDFTEPFHEETVVLVAKYRNSPLPKLNLETFAAISVQSWILILCLTLMTFVIIYWMERVISLKSNFETGVQILAYVIGLLFQRDVGGLVPRNLGSRVVSVSLALALMIVMTAYTAVLTTQNIVDTKILPISGLRDPKLMNSETNIKIGTYKDSPFLRLFEKSDLATWRNMAKIMQPQNFEDAFEAEDKLIKDTLQGAIMEESFLQTRWKIGLNCDFAIVQNILKQPLAFAVPKKSSWKEPLSNLIRKYQENGFLHNQKRKYMASECPTKMNQQPHQFSLLYLSGACIMLVLGILLSITVFTMECFFRPYLKKFVRKRKSSYSLQHADYK